MHSYLENLGDSLNKATIESMQVFREVLHNSAKGSHIEVQIDRCVHNLFKHHTEEVFEDRLASGTLKLVSRALNQVGTESDAYDLEHIVIKVFLLLFRCLKRPVSL